MSSRFPRAAAALALMAVVTAASGRELRVCADPDNLPYSHWSGAGFENRIARLVAQEMGARLVYAWLPHIRGYVRKTLGAGLCDVFVGVPTGFERLATTRPYYRSSYVFVTAPGAAAVRSLDDPRLATLRIGVQLVGDDFATTPPAHALAARGVIDNVRGFPVMGEGPAAQRMAHALAERRIDVGLAWGPPAAYFAARAPAPLQVNVAAPAPGTAPFPFEFSISMGVKRGNDTLREELDAILSKRRADIDAILAEYGVPRTDLAPGGGS